MDLLRTADGLYSVLLRLYPPAFQTEFGLEMRTVFLESIRDAQQRGFPAVLGLGMRELGDFPINLISEHWEENSMKNLQLAQPVNRPIWWGAVGFGCSAALAKILSDVFMGQLFPSLNGIAYYWFPWLEIPVYAFAGWLGGTIFGLASQQAFRVRRFGFAGFSGFLIGRLLGVFTTIGLTILQFYANVSDSSAFSLTVLFRMIDLLLMLVCTGVILGLLEKDRKQAARLALGALSGTAAGGVAALALCLIAMQLVRTFSAFTLAQTGLLFIVNAVAAIFGGAMLGREIGRRGPSLENANSPIGLESPGIGNLPDKKGA